MVAGSSPQEVPKPTIIRDWDNTGRRVLHLLLCSSPGVCSWPQLHTEHWAGTTTFGVVWLLFQSLHLLPTRAPLLRAVCGLTFSNIKEFLRNRGVKIVRLREEHFRGCACECAHWDGSVRGCMHGLTWQQRSKPHQPRTTWRIRSED